MPPRQAVAEGERPRREQQEPRQQAHEARVGCSDEQYGADEAARQADAAEPQERRLRHPDVAPIRNDARHRTRPHRQRRRRVRHDGTDAGVQERGNRDERAAAGDGVEGAGEDGDEKQQDDHRRNHRGTEHRDYQNAVGASRSPRFRGVSRKAAERGQQLEPRAPQRVFRDGHGGVGVAGAALGVDDLDVRRGAGAEADVRDVDDLLRLVGCRPCARQPALRALHRLARDANLGARSGERAGQKRLRDVERRLPLGFLPLRWPLSKIGTDICSRNRQLLGGEKNCAGYVDCGRNTASRYGQ